MKKQYWLLVILLGVFVLDWYIKAPDSRSRELNHALEANASDALKKYPYKFHVLRMDGDIALLSTPRNVEVPAFKALGVLYPEINVKDPNNPAFIAAEQHLAAVQSEARAIILSQPGVKDVRWELDRDWLTSHYIEVPAR